MKPHWNQQVMSVQAPVPVCSARMDVWSCPPCQTCPETLAGGFS